MRGMPFKVLAVAFVAAQLATLALSSATEPFVTFTVSGAASLQPGNHSIAAKNKNGNEMSLIVNVGAEDVRLSVESSVDGMDPFMLKVGTTGSPTEISSGPIAVHAASVTLLQHVKRNQLPTGDLTVELVMPEPLTTTFEFTLEKPLELATNSYDLRPAYSAFGTYYVVNVTESTISWYVKRRPPIPGFLAFILDGSGKEVSRAPVNNVPADGVGFVDVIDKTKDYPEIDLSSITLRTTFYELPRSFSSTASVSIQDALDTIDKDGKVVLNAKEGDGFAFQLERGRHDSEDVTVTIVQPHGIANLLVQVTNDDGVVVFQEQERRVPPIAADAAVQFGWVNSLARNSSKQFLYLKAFYDKRVEATGAGAPLSKLNDLVTFVNDYGGFTENVEAVALKDGTAAFKAKTDLTTGAPLVEIPFRLVLQHEVCDAVPGIKDLLEDDLWQEFIADRPPVLANIVSLTLCQLMMPNSPFDGTNWRVMYESYFPKTPDLPMFWDKEERETLLGWSAANKEIDMQLEVWEEEFKVAQESLLGNISRNIRKEEYFAARAHMMSKLVNASNSMILPPLLPNFPHDDDATAAATLDHDRRVYRLYTTRDVKAGTLLTVDKGAQQKFKTEFLVHHGVVPIGAVDSATVDGIELPLTRDKRSRTAVVDAIRRKNTSKTLNELIGERLSALPSSISGDSPRAHMAQRLLAAERAVLEAHRNYIAEDSEDL